jgi:formate dehydrogenase iron-sulfur subunit
MLFDATICVGCRACQSACKKRADRPLPPHTDSSSLYEAPLDLSADTWTLIKLYTDEAGHNRVFCKYQCMHCIEPACVSVCPVAALEKTPSGPVIYHPYQCIGCRYCMMACPYSIPRYQWNKAFPLVQKCDFCAERQLNGDPPACSEACPTGALLYGKRSGLLEEARLRQRIRPGAYVSGIYGEKEAGGTLMLYLSPVDFTQLGWPDLDETVLPSYTWPYLVAVPGVIVFVAATMSALYVRTHRS